MYLVDNIYSQNIVATETLASRTSAATVAYDYAYPIQIRWKDSDFAANPAAGSVGSSPSSPIPTPTPTPTPKSAGLSTGAIAAISVVLGLLALVGLGYVVYCIRKRRRAGSGNRKVPIQGSELEAPIKPELADTSFAVLPELAGRDTLPRAELEAKEMKLGGAAGFGLPR
jgi:hypothetical protein